MILLVDASKFIRHVLQQQLTESGYICNQSADGIDAFKQFRRYQPKIVLLDLLTPKMSGLTLLRLMKNINKNVQVIVFTSSSHRKVVFSAIRNGAADYIIKPFSITEVVCRIKRLINNHAAKGGTVCCSCPSNTSGPE